MLNESQAREELKRVMTEKFQTQVASHLESVDHMSDGDVNNLLARLDNEWVPPRTNETDKRAELKSNLKWCFDSVLTTLMALIDSAPDDKLRRIDMEGDSSFALDTFLFER